MLRERPQPAAPEADLFEACYGLILVIVIVIVIVVVFITIVVMVVVVLSGMFAMPLATALIMPMHPVVMVFPPIPGYPHPFVATVPIARTIGVIRPITHVDGEPDRHGAWPDQHANRQESHCKNRKFRFHSRCQLFV